MSFGPAIGTYLDRLKEAIDLLDRDALDRFIQALVGALERDADIYVFGNGGSAAAASHLVVDVGTGASRGAVRKFRIHCLSDNVPTLTATANDLSYEDVFSDRLEGRLRPDDVVIAISGSGNSENVLRGVRHANEVGAVSLAICGFDGGELKGLVDIPVHLPVHDMQICEDSQAVITHIVMRALCDYQGIEAH